MSQWYMTETSMFVFHTSLHASVATRCTNFWHPFGFKCLQSATTIWQGALFFSSPQSSCPMALSLRCLAQAATNAITQAASPKAPRTPMTPKTPKTPKTPLSAKNTRLERLRARESYESPKSDFFPERRARTRRTVHFSDESDPSPSVTESDCCVPTPSVAVWKAAGPVLLGRSRAPDAPGPVPSSEVVMDAAQMAREAFLARQARRAGRMDDFVVWDQQDFRTSTWSPKGGRMYAGCHIKTDRQWMCLRKNIQNHGNTTSYKCLYSLPRGAASLLDGLVTHTHCTGVVNTPGFEFKWAIQPHWSLLILDHWIHVRFESAQLQIPSWCAPGAERYLVCPMKVEAWEEENKTKSIEQLSVILTLKTWGANVWRELSTCNYWAAQHMPGKDCNRLLSEEARLLGEKRCLSSTFRNRAVSGWLDFSFSVEENMCMLHHVLELSNLYRFEDAGMHQTIFGMGWLSPLVISFRSNRLAKVTIMLLQVAQGLWLMVHMLCCQA